MVEKEGRKEGGGCGDHGNNGRDGGDGRIDTVISLHTHHILKKSTQNLILYFIKRNI